MRKMPNLFLVKGFTFRIIGLAIICVAPWLSFMTSGDIDLQDIDLTMYFAAFIGAASYIIGIIVKFYSERTPNTMRIKLTQNTVFATLLSLCFIAICLLGSILRNE